MSSLHHKIEDFPVRKPIHSEEDIIAEATALESKLNRLPSPWEVHKALGKRGKLERVTEILEAHRSAAVEDAPCPEIALPVNVETQLDTAIAALRTALDRVTAGLASSLVDENRRQILLQQRDHLMQQHELQKEIRHLKDENVYLKELLEEAEADHDRCEAENAKTNASSPSPAGPEPQAPASDAASSAAHRCLGRALPKTRPAVLRPRSAQQRRRKAPASDRRQT